MLWNKKSNRIWNGQASKGKHRSLSNINAIMKMKDTIMKLWEKLYIVKTQSGIVPTAGRPNSIFIPWDNNLTKKYSPNDNRSGRAPNNNAKDPYLRYPNNPLPQSVWLNVSIININN